MFLSKSLFFLNDGKGSLIFFLNVGKGFLKTLLAPDDEINIITSAKKVAFANICQYLSIRL